MDEAASGLAVLWESSGGAFVVPLIWGAFVSALTLVALLALWFSARARGWLAIASGAAWARQVTLAIWVVLLVPASGAAGAVYGAQRATLALLHETQVIERSCGIIAAGLVLAASERSDALGRIPVTQLRAVWSFADASVNEARDRAIQAAIDEQLAAGATRDAASQVARWGAAALQRELVGGRTDAIEGILVALEARAAADGTIAVEEAGVVLTESYVTPAIRDLLIGAFRPYYLTLWGLVALGVAIPFAAAGWSRRSVARASVAPPR